MKFYIILFLFNFIAINSHAKPYLIEDHLKTLSQKKSTKKWSIKSAIKGKNDKGTKVTPLPKINFTAQNIQENPMTEFGLGLEYGNLNLDIDGVKDRYEVYRASVTGFIRFVGFMGNFYLTENSKENYGDVSMAVRLVGSSQQNTHLMLFYGVSKTKELDAGLLKNVNNYIYGGELVLYFLDFLAASYRLTHYKENTENDIFLRRKGRRHEVKVFVDFDYFRVFGSHVLEILEFQNTTFNRRDSQGLMGGVMLFF